uniref:Uncharacterized protein n=1 Tax=Stylophora pistillata TaxID=50429 RepID=A0A2B4R816_STYPI
MGFTKEVALGIKRAIKCDRVGVLVEGLFLVSCTNDLLEETQKQTPEPSQKKADKVADAINFINDVFVEDTIESVAPVAKPKPKAYAVVSAIKNVPNPPVLYYSPDKFDVKNPNPGLVTYLQEFIANSIRYGDMAPEDPEDEDGDGFRDDGSGRVATIVLQSLTKEDVTIENCEFEITKAAAETFTFNPLKRKFVKGGGTFTSQQILAQVTGGDKNNYTIKSIDNFAPSGLATPNGKTINYSKPGAFTARIILQHPTKSDATIPNASFYVPVTWDKTFGGADEDESYAITQTKDDGYVVAGYSKSAGGSGAEDFWIVKLDQFGEKVWEKKFGGSKKDIAHSIIETSDGKYVVAGETKSKKATNGGGTEFWVMKLNTDGSKIWDVAYGKKYTDQAYSIVETSDGGFAVAGSVRQSTAQKLDFWILKLNSTGGKTWEKNYGGTEDDIAYSIVQTTDGGFAVAGSTKSGSSGKEDFWVMKLASDGTKTWEKKFGGSDSDVPTNIIQTSDGGYAIAGETKSKGAGNYDFWILKLTSSGTKTWEKTFGGSDDDRKASIVQTTDGGYAVAGHKKNKGNYDAWLLKINSTGTKTWDKTFVESGSDRVYSLIKTKYGGYAFTGSTNSKGAGNFDFWVVKVDKDGDL